MTIAFVVAALLATSSAAREMAFLLPKASYNMTKVCCDLRGFRCLTTFPNAAYGETDLSKEELATRVSVLTDKTVAVGFEVLQDATPGTLHPATVQPTAPKADIAFAYDARRSLKQFDVPKTIAQIQVGAPWHLAFLNAKQSAICNITGTECQFRDDAYVYRGTGKGVRVYAVGEAIDESHEDFYVAGGNKFSPDSFVFEDYLINETCSRWQGTHVAALIAGKYYGVAKDAELVSVAVKPGCRRVGSARALAEGVQWIIRHLEKSPSKAIVVVDAKVSVRQPDLVVVDIIEQLVDSLIDAGVVVVATAGALQVDACAFTPSRMPRAITAAGAEVVQLPTRMVARPWLESNYGACVNIWAPGAMIESAFSPDSDSTAVYSGTTPASAMVSGVLATLMENYPEDALDALVERLYNASSTSIMLYTRPGTVSNVLQNPVE
jgi:Subtilase family